MTSDNDNTRALMAQVDSLVIQRDAAEALARERKGELELCWCVATESSPDDAPDPHLSGLAYKAVDAMQDREYAAEARAIAAEAREEALGLQVVAQAARLRLANEAIEALRLFDHQRTDRALAAWYSVPGDVAPVDLG